MTDSLNARSAVLFVGSTPQYRVNLPPEMIDTLKLGDFERVTILVYGNGEEPTIIEND